MLNTLCCLLRWTYRARTVQAISEAFFEILQYKRIFASFPHAYEHDYGRAQEKIYANLGDLL